MNAVVSLLTILLPQLYQYFTKNKGLNTVTGAAGGSLLTLLLIGMQNGYYDQAITFLQNNWEYGGYATAVMVGLRAAVQAYSAYQSTKSA
ncbi:hypothetical protein ELG77_09060 [Rhizobium leguminosarum]|uniref:hypothetical protein n=1 Tax=Rhizobium leguminosarum TaxID=384 RepID=UPI00102FC84F|nr:hypothetical protein [Rhizobium leguminosarum]TBG37171.1 hypothetical protein ELG78_09330 [Rhizobium leguminosarum]TBG41909.1 hypothetical protein ELG77_09060 [Rhizobium leguminosarum]